MSINRIACSLVVATIVLVAASYAPLGARQGQADEQGQALPGCAIPKSYGRLVTIIAGNNTGLAGQAVFEAENGVIRWVPFMFNSTATIPQKPARRPPPALFPTLPMFECVQGHVWERP